ncbi:hypothetical protein AVEN_121601-1 [Araneus ventricosus]|uniref:Uncharacterized protein n=1 Tax=Araneus ventricosus TaxID=182803 RepID=A0A4Y2LUK2_ARAVE|nr:hypothetical protein AVEN_121601-1 [Araneus ventricosus]
MTSEVDRHEASDIFIFSQREFDYKKDRIYLFEYWEDQRNVWSPPATYILGAFKVTSNDKKGLRSPKQKLHGELFRALTKIVVPVSPSSSDRGSKLRGPSPKLPSCCLKTRH